MRALLRRLPNCVTDRFRLDRSVSMVEQTVFPTTNPASLWRKRKATLLSLLWKQGDVYAGWRLRQRRCGYLSLSAGMPMQERLALANAARARNRAARLEAETKATLEKRELTPFMQSSRDL